VPKVFAVFLIHKDGTTLFSKTYVTGWSDTELVTGYITALSSLAREISPDKRGALRSIDAGEVKFLLESGRNILGALAVDFEDRYSRDALRMIVDRFEQRYSAELEEWDGDLSKFEDFEQDLEKILRIITIREFHIPHLVKRTASDVKINRDYWPIVSAINGQRTIEEISREVEVGLEETIERIKDLMRDGIVTVDILYPSRYAASVGEELIARAFRELSKILGAKIAKKYLIRSMGAFEEYLDIRDTVVRMKNIELLSWSYLPAEIFNIAVNAVQKLADVAGKIIGAVSRRIAEKVRKSVLEEHISELGRLHIIERGEL